MAYDDAVSTLQAMFPEWDKETLETVLTSNNYHVERTIESIFIMQGDAVSPSGGNNAPSPSQPTQDLLFVEEDVPVRPSKPSRQVNKKRRNSTPGYRGLKCDLPDSFLRPPYWEGSRHIIADEELALMLQNEMFQREVRRMMGDDFLRGDPNTEFIDPRYQSGQGRGQVNRSNSVGGPSRGGTINRVTPHGGGNNNNANDSADLGIMKALSSMGGAAKKNLSMLAERFAASGGSGSANTGTAKEFKPLVDSGGNSNNDDEEDGDEVISFEHNKNRNSHTLHDSPTPSSEFQNPLLMTNSNYRGTNNVGLSGKKDK